MITFAFEPEGGEQPLSATGPRTRRRREEFAVPYPERFAGYQSPRAVLQDATLSTELKLSALLGWRAAAEAKADTIDPHAHKRLIAAIERAVVALRRG
jgi:hypothetical protein